MGCILCQGQVEEQMTSGTALFRTLSSSAIWMEFINMMTFLASYFCILPAPRIHGTTSILVNSSPRVSNLEVNPVLRHWTCKALSYELWVRHYWIVAVSLCSHTQLCTTTLCDLPVDPLRYILSLPNFSLSNIPWEENPTTERNSRMPMSLFCVAEMSMFLELYLLSARHLQSSLQSTFETFSFTHTPLPIQHILLDLPEICNFLQ